MEKIPAERILRDYVSAERFMACADVIWSTDRRSGRPRWRGVIPAGSLVYAKRDHAGMLFRELARTRSRIVLVTAESDDAVIDGAAREIPAQVAAWFSTNSSDSLVGSIPLGLGNSYCQVTAKAGDLARVAGLDLPRDKWLLVNFRPETNPARREPLLRNYQAAAWATVHPGGLEREMSLRETASHRFVLCPPGNGIDTHRMWEALYLGAIPIVENHPALKAFAELPILCVDDLSKIDETRLQREYEAFCARSWDLRKLFFPYWKEVVENERARLLTGARKISPWRMLSSWIRWAGKS